MTNDISTLEDSDLLHLVQYKRGQRWTRTLPSSDLAVLNLTTHLSQDSYAFHSIRYLAQIYKYLLLFIQEWKLEFSLHSKTTF